MQRVESGDSAKLTAVGLLAGVGGVLALNRLLTSLLFGVKPFDPLTLLSVSAFIAAVATAACYLPARRATRVDPMRVLRVE